MTRAQGPVAEPRQEEGGKGGGARARREGRPRAEGLVHQTENNNAMLLD